LDWYGRRHIIVVGCTITAMTFVDADAAVAAIIAAAAIAAGLTGQ
jgi:hypothetical protein